ncbi:MAG: hypothetical protein N2544_11125 [Burkholderiales bacterium]|nr:hypothetical protein [Burkholderiales bacterium]
MRAAAGAAILAWALGASGPAAAAPPLAPARDLAAEAREAAASGRVLVVLFATADCPWCARVRAEFLGPMQANPRDARRILVREVDIDADRPLTGFDGERTTHAGFAAKAGIRFVPVVAFYGTGGTELAERLVGFRVADWYGAYLDRRIDEALARRVPR